MEIRLANQQVNYLKHTVERFAAMGLRIRALQSHVKE